MGPHELPCTFRDTALSKDHRLNSSLVMAKLDGQPVRTAAGDGLQRLVRMRRPVNPPFLLVGRLANAVVSLIDMRCFGRGALINFFVCGRQLFLNLQIQQS